MKKQWILVVAIALLVVGLSYVSLYGNQIVIGKVPVNFFSAGDYAFGVFAAGTFSVGIFSAGIFSIGVFSIGIFNIGLYALGIFLIAWKKKLSNLGKMSPE